MSEFNLPGASPELKSAINRFLRQVLSFPFRLWRVATADLPSASDENKGGIAWDETLSRLTYSTGAAWATVMPYTAGAALTKSDDTNVTLTLGGSPTTALLAATSLTLGWTGSLSVARGGTGRTTSTTAYGLIAAGTTATGAHQTLAAGATTEILVGGGASALPVWTTATGSGAPVRATSPTIASPTLSGNIGLPGSASWNSNGEVGIKTVASSSYTFNVNGNGSTGAGVVTTLRLSGGTMTTSGDATRLLFIQRHANDDYGGFVQVRSTASSPANLAPVMEFAIQNSATNTIANIGVKMTLSSAAMNLASGVALQINGTQVVTARQTGWGAATGTATRTAIATYTAPTISSPPTQAEVQAIADALQAWSRRAKATTDDLATHGLIGA